MLRETLGAIHRLEDLPQLAGALGFSPVWRELPAGCLGTTRAAVVGRSGEFEWYGVSGVSGGAVRRVSCQSRVVLGRYLPGRPLGDYLIKLTATSLTVYVPPP